METRKFFCNVKPLHNERIQVELASGTMVYLNMHRRMKSIRFSLLKDKTIFDSVKTDGFRLIFYQQDTEVLEISPSTFMDLIAIDRTK